MRDRPRWWLAVAGVVVVGAAGTVLYQLLVAGPSVTFYTQPRGPSHLRVLFVGNSLTYFNDMPGIVAGMLTLRHPELRPQVAMVSAPGYTLREHFENGRVLQVLSDQRWDVVVLQERGGYAIDHPGETRVYAQRLAAAAQRSGGKSMLFVDWFQASASQPPGQAEAEIASALGLSTLPAGPVLARLHQELPRLELLQEDGQHPSPAGSYAIALIAYVRLLGESPAGLPPAFDLARPHGRQRVGGGVDSAIAASLQARIWRLLQTSVV